MSERIIICSSARMAAEFCREERALAAAANGGRRGRGRGGWRGRGRGGRRDPQRDRLTNQAGPNRGRVEKRRQRKQKIDRSSYGINETLSFYNGRLVVGDSILVRGVRAAGGNISKNNLTCYGGATVSSLLQKVKCSTTGFPSKAAVLIGTNDLMNGSSNDDVLSGVNELLCALKDRRVSDIILMTIPPPWQQGKRSTQDWHYVNEKIKLINSQGVTILETHKLFLNDDGSIKKHLFERFHADGRKDLLHPNRKGLQEIMEALSSIHNANEAVSRSSTILMDTQAEIGNTI